MEPFLCSLYQSILSHYEHGKQISTPRQIRKKGHALTEAVPCCAECAANLATWFIIGEKLVGP